MADNVSYLKYKKCCVPRCLNRPGRRHRFPKREPKIFDQWIEIIKPENYDEYTKEEIYHRFYVCDDHFSAESFNPGSQRGLMRNAVPTVCSSDLPAHPPVPEPKLPAISISRNEASCSVEIPRPSLRHKQSTCITASSSEMDEASTMASANTFEGIENNYTSIKEVDNDMTFHTDESEVMKLEYTSDEDEIGELTVESKSKQVIASDILVSTKNSDFILRKKMFKMFVNKIIDEITNEKDLDALEQIFAYGVPLPSQVQNNVKKL